MLVLSRKEAERIRLGDSIVITVIRIGGDKVRLGIEAPSDILVLRDELEPHELEILQKSQEVVQSQEAVQATQEPQAPQSPQEPQAPAA